MAQRKGGKQHAVDVSRRVQPTATRRVATDDVLRDLDAARARGDDEAVRELMEQAGVFNIDPPEAVEDADTLGDVLDYLCATHGGWYERKLRDDGKVVIVFHRYEDEDVLSGVGGSTREAVRALAAKLGTTWEG